MRQYPPQYAILIHYGEIGLKGQNQPQFRGRLGRNIALKLQSLGLDWRIRQPQGSFAVMLPIGEESKIEMATQGLREVFGIAWLTPARRLKQRAQTVESQKQHLDEIERHIVEIADAQFVPDKSFAVRLRRADKLIPFTSVQLEARYGAAIREKTKWRTVSLKAPDATFQVEIRDDATYVFSQRLVGPRGLPVGVTGRVLTLLSGGIDSPVAAYLIAKRGCPVDFIHFTASSVSVEQAKQEKMWRMVQQLNRYTLGSRLFIVPYTFFDFALMQNQARYEVILFRRFMVRVAQQLAKTLKAQALVNGDNLAQVASQTLSNLASSSKPAEIPILRPVLTHDKEEIVDLARKIGTYDISIEPYKDCCALVARNPSTSSKLEKVEHTERIVFSDYQKIIDDTLKEAICLEP